MFGHVAGMAYWHRVDREGRPVMVLRLGHHDPERFSAETTVRYVIWKLEQGLAMQPHPTIQGARPFHQVCCCSCTCFSTIYAWIEKLTRAASSDKERCAPMSRCVFPLERVSLSQKHNCQRLSAVCGRFFRAGVNTVTCVLDLTNATTDNLDMSIFRLLLPARPPTNGRPQTVHVPMTPVHE